MDRRAFTTIVAGSILLAPLAAEAQAPKLAKIGMLLPATSVGSPQLVEAFRLGSVELGQIEGKTFALELRYAEGKSKRLQGLARELIGALGLPHRLPAIFWGPQFPLAGGLMAYGPDGTYLWQRAGALVSKILDGSKPADLPIEQADRFRLIVNLKTAKTLGLTIPQSVLLRADQLIE